MSNSGPIVLGSAFVVGFLLSLSHRKVTRGMSDIDVERYQNPINANVKLHQEHKMGYRALAAEDLGDGLHDTRRGWAKWFGELIDRDAGFMYHTAKSSKTKDDTLMHNAQNRFVLNYAY